MTWNDCNPVQILMSLWFICHLISISFVARFFFFGATETEFITFFTLKLTKFEKYVQIQLSSQFLKLNTQKCVKIKKKTKNAENPLKCVQRDFQKFYIDK